MTITIELPPATLEKLKAEAQATGKDVQTFVREAVEAKLARRQQTFAEILKPIHDVVQAADVEEHVPIAFRLDRDPDDEPYLNLAIAMQPSFLVSRDKDLLDLMKDDSFRKAFPGLTIIEPIAFLAHVRVQIDGDLGK